jgi:hypothetical protein
MIKLLCLKGRVEAQIAPTKVMIGAARRPLEMAGEDFSPRRREGHEEEGEKRGKNYESKRIKNAAAALLRRKGEE